MAIHKVSAIPRNHWEIVPENSSVKFTIGWSPLHRVRGQFRRLRGSLAADGDELSSATMEVEIDAASVETGIKIRDGHVRNALFLNVGRFPTISFESTGVEDVGQNRFRVWGELSIRGTTREVTLHGAVDRHDGECAEISASALLDRRDFKLGPKTMGIMAGNSVQVEIALLLRAQ
jgi:polyisoprenoid-binding protein YceI